MVLEEMSTADLVSSARREIEDLREHLARLGVRLDERSEEGLVVGAFLGSACARLEVAERRLAVGE